MINSLLSTFLDFFLLALKKEVYNERNLLFVGYIIFFLTY